MTAFSKTAREYYKSEFQDSNNEAGMADNLASVTEPDANEPAKEQTGSNKPPEDATHIPTELPIDNQLQHTEVDKESRPFAHLSRKEYLKRIGIIN